MASISSVITGGFGTPGSASLVITDGFGTAGVAPVVSITGRARRRGRRPIWDLERKKVDAQALREEQAYIAALVAERAAYDLWQEQQVLREALELATTRQRKTISAMIQKIERRMAEIEDDDAAVVLLM